MSAEKKSATRHEIDKLLEQRALKPAHAQETTVECNLWGLPTGYGGTVAYLRERPSLWVRFTVQGIKSSRAVEVLLRDALKTMTGGST
jgi:hypothetical protein